MPRPPLSKPAPPRAKRAHSQEIVTAILTAAIEVGPEASLAAIAKRAGVGAASLHRYFPTTTALFAEVSRQMFRTFLGQLREIAARPGLGLREGVDAMCRVALAGPHVSLEYRRRLNLEIPLSWSRDAAAEVYREMLDVLYTWMRGRSTHPEADLRARLFVAFGVVRGATLTSLLFPDLAPPTEELVQKTTTAVMALLA